MNHNTKDCQSCNRGFEVAAQEGDLWDRLGVGHTSFCPDCRAQRRMLWRNERSLYRRACDLCNKNIIAIYSTDKTFKVFCETCFHGDAWNPLNYGMDLDFKKPFLQQFRELQFKVPRQYAFVFQNVNSEYTNGSAFNKNCYLLFVSDHNEDCLYSYSVFDCLNSMDCQNSNECELCYESVTCKKCYRVFFSQDCSNSQDLYFSKNCANCHDCVGCVDLRNKSYCIFNEQYSKEDYQKKVAELCIDSRKGLKELTKKACEFWPGFPSKFIHGYQNNNVSGDYVFNSKNVIRGYDSEMLEDCSDISLGNKAKNCSNGYVVVDGCEYSNEIVSAIALNNVKSSYCAWHVFDSAYCDSCENSNNLFGCVGMKKNQYCILNKQYSKEEYEKLIPQIMEHMNKMPYRDGAGKEYMYGEYFPPELSPFAYNETVAQEYFPITKEEALKSGYAWKEKEASQHQATLSADSLPDKIEDAKDEILNEVINCAHKGECSHGCSTAFKLTPAELQLYRKLNIPIPDMCSNCRHALRFGGRNPMKLWDRQCMCPAPDSTYKNTGTHLHDGSPCAEKFETTYPPTGSGIIYCEACYQAEVS